jgi:serine/threonine protein phosphatase PrpC
MMSGISRWLRSLLNGEPARERERVLNGEGDGCQGAQEAAIEHQVAIEIDSRSVYPTDAFEVGWRTDTGVVRDHNEDAVYVFTGCLDAGESTSGFGLFMVADGMGGHACGEKASALALRTAASCLINGVYVPLLSGVERGAEQPAIGDVVRQAAEAANAAVGRELPGSGTTLTYGVVAGSRLFVGHVGDSRVYLLRGVDAPRALTQDHSLVRRLVEVGQLTEAEAVVHPDRSLLYRAVGQPEALDVDVSTLPLESGDQLLLCSDGLWNMVDEAEIQSVITSSEDVQTACERLVEAANAAGGEDNITVVLAKMNIQ